MADIYRYTNCIFVCIIMHFDMKREWRPILGKQLVEPVFL